jgi:nicotinamidase-related amidase
LSEWQADLKSLPLKDVVKDPARMAICSVDMLNGFCYEGNLASPRAADCVEPIVNLLKQAHSLGVRNYVLIQEWHSEQAEEFKAYGQHCVRDSLEAQTVPEIASLPFAGDFVITHKNSLHTIVDTEMEQWLRQHAEVDTFIVVGVCTDLCTYDLAMDLRLRANARDLRRRVIVPTNAVNTYSLPVAVARQLSMLPHDADLLHTLFLYMMTLNKIEVVRELT